MSRKVRNINVNILKFDSVLWQDFTHARSLVPWPSTFSTMGTDIFSIIIAFFFLRTKMFQFRCIEMKTPDNCRVHRSQQNGESSVWNCFVRPFLPLACGGSF